MSVASRVVKVSSQVDLHALDWGGSGPPLLLLHGLCGRCTEWKDVGDSLSSNFRVIALDQRGHGLSSKPSGPYDARAYVGDLAEFMDALRVNSANIIGHSMGGRIAWCFAAWHPDRVERLVIEDQHPLPEPDGSARWRALLNLPFPFKTREEALTALKEKGGAGFADWLSYSLTPIPGGWGLVFSAEAMAATKAELYTEDHSPLLASVRCPTLLACGENSTVLQASQARQMAGLIPNCRLKIFSETGHWIHRERFLEFIQLARSFLLEEQG